MAVETTSERLKVRKRSQSRNRRTHCNTMAVSRSGREDVTKCTLDLRAYTSKTTKCPGVKFTCDDLKFLGFLSESSYKAKPSAHPLSIGSRLFAIHLTVMLVRDLVAGFHDLISVCATDNGTERDRDNSLIILHQTFGLHLPGVLNSLNHRGEYSRSRIFCFEMKALW